MATPIRRDLYAHVTARITAELERGALPWIKPWSATPGQNVPCNAVTNRPYSGCNVILLWLTRGQGWATPRFLTFKQAQEAGGNVRKGEHETKVYFVKQLQVQGDGEGDDPRIVPMMREYTVFNVAQCDGLPASIVGGRPGRVRNPDTRDALASFWRRLALTFGRVIARPIMYLAKGAPKSAAGTRTVPLSTKLITMLREWKLRSPFSRDRELIFPNGDGGHLGHDNFIKRQFLPLFETAGVARFNWHGLRHFAVSCWIEAGLAPKTVQTFAGHASLAITMDRYGHLFPSDDHRNVMDAIARGPLS